MTADHIIRGQRLDTLKSVILGHTAAEELVFLFHVMSAGNGVRNKSNDLLLILWLMPVPN